MDVDLIAKMGFFVRELHNHIAALHSKQCAGQDSSKSFIVYRGQQLSQTNFEEMVKTKGGLLAFSNFLSISKNRTVYMINSDSVGVLFVMTIDPSIPLTPFADVRVVSAYETEEEILFSMHSVFHIGKIEQIEENDRLWEVELTLTSDNDPPLQTVTERMREETKRSTEWLRLGKLR
jgi:hypothetical protein